MNIHLFVKFMMDFLRKTICLLVVYVLQMTIGLYGKPDLDFFMNATCPASKPYKCEPYALCYDSEHYCDNGEVKSCFPPKISTNDTAILEWCGQSNSSNLLDATCRFACYSHFVSKSTTEKRWPLPSCFPQHNANDSESLLVWCQKHFKEDFTSLPHPSCKYMCIDTFNASVLYQSSPYENGISSDLLLVLAIFLVVSFVGNIALLVYLYRTRRGQPPADVKHKAPGDKNPGKEPEASSVNDSKDSDIKVHQSLPNNEKLSPKTNCAMAQGINRAPGKSNHDSKHEFACTFDEQCALIKRNDATVSHDALSQRDLPINCQF